MNVRSRRRVGCIASTAAAAALVVAVAPAPARADAGAGDACRPVRSGLHAERIRQEAARGMPSFKRFVMRTRMTFQLDFASEVARLDAERAARDACRADGTPSTRVAATASGDR